MMTPIMIDYSPRPPSTPPQPVDERGHDSTPHDRISSEANAPAPMDRAAMRDRILVPAPGARNQPLPRLTINRRSGNTDNVEETILKLYHAEQAMQQPEIAQQHRHVVRQIESWRKRPLTKIVRYVFLTAVELTSNRGGEQKWTSILTAVGVDEFGVREVLGVTEAATDAVSSWLEFLQQLKRRGLFGVDLFIGDRHEGLANRLSTLFPGARYQNGTEQFQRDFLAQVPAGYQPALTRKLNEIFSSPDWPAAKRLISAMSAELNQPELAAAAGFFGNFIWESMNHLEFPKPHRQLLQSNRAPLELLPGKGEQARAAGDFSDGPGAVHWVSARLRHIEAKVWNEKCVAPGC